MSFRASVDVMNRKWSGTQRTEANLANLPVGHRPSAEGTGSPARSNWASRGGHVKQQGPRRTCVEGRAYDHVVDLDVDEEVPAARDDGIGRAFDGYPHALRLVTRTTTRAADQIQLECQPPA